jgi:hypothetical protein
MKEKKWWKSKIFWAGIIGMVTAISGLLTGEATIEEGAMAVISGFIAIFRLFFTTTNLTT